MNELFEYIKTLSRWEFFWRAWLLLYILGWFIRLTKAVNKILEKG